MWYWKRLAYSVAVYASVSPYTVMSLNWKGQCTHRVLARQVRHVRVIEGNFGCGEFDAALKPLIFTVRELLIVKLGDPARLNAPTKPCIATEQACQLCFPLECVLLL